MRGNHSKTEGNKNLGRESCLCRDCNNNNNNKKWHHHRIGRKKKVYKKGEKKVRKGIYNTIHTDTTQYKIF